MTTATIPTPASPASQASQSMVDTFARRYVVPLALLLDVATMAIRVTETSVQLILPDVFTAWSAHTSLALAIAFYTLNLTVIVGLALGVTASLYLAMPLLALINRKLDNAQHIRKARVRRDKVAALERQRQRTQQYIGLAILVPLLFGISFALSNLHLSWLVWVTALADIAAPIIVLFVITQTERAAGETDAQEQAVGAANGVVLQAVRNISHTAGGMLQAAQAAMLRAATDGDIGAMIDAATPRDATTRYLSINDICDRLTYPTDRDAPERRRVARRVKDTYDRGGTEIVRGDRGQGYLVPGTLFDELFGDWPRGQAVATPRTPRTTAPTPVALNAGVAQASVTTLLPHSDHTTGAGGVQPAPEGGQDD